MIKGRGEKPALIMQQQTISYAVLNEKINEFSSLLTDFTDCRIAVFSENRPEWVYAFYAIWKNGCVPVPIDFMASVDDIAFILNDCKPKAIFCSNDKLLSVLNKAIEKIDYTPTLFVFDKLENNTTTKNSELTIAPPQENTAAIIYTSGTTGNPKGVMLSFKNLLVNIKAVSEDINIYKEEDITMMLLPLHHIFPLMGTMIIPLYTGATIALSPSLNANDIMQTLQENKVSLIIGVPRLYSIIRKGIIDKINQSAIAKLLFALAKRVNSLSFSKIVFKSVQQKFGGNVKHLVSGGAPLSPEVALDYKALGFDLLEGYGMTETSPIITFTRPGELIAGSPGKALTGVEIKILDGEIVVSGGNVMQGYYKREEETREILKDGWLHTGDLGHVDSKGFLHITGRKKEIIVLSNGKNINPEEIEQKLEKISPVVKESGVFMFNDKLNVVILPDIDLLRKEKIENVELFLRNEVVKPYNDSSSSSKRLMKLNISYEELPKTRLGKLQRFKLVDFAQQEAKKTKKDLQEVEMFKELSTIIGFLKEQIGGDIQAYDRLEDDLGLDSLSRISLIVYLESTFGVKIPEENLSQFETVLKLAEYIRSNKIRITPEIINWTKILKEKVHINLPKAGFSFNVFNFSYKAIFRSMFRLRQEGATNIPKGPCIIAPNHQSVLDGFVIASLLKRKTMRQTYIYAKEKHWQRSWLRFLARKNNIILMDINKDLKLSIQKMAEVLKRGKNLIIFPEGTRSKNGELGEFKKTFAILAKELNVPVVPVSIKGVHKILPVGAKFPRFFRKVSVKFNKPVYPNNNGVDKIVEKVQKILLNQLRMFP